jgi:hypothetical protein
MKELIEGIIKKELHGFYYRISEFEFLSHKMLRVTIAASDKLINGCSGEYPQRITFQLDKGTMDLNLFTSVYRDVKPWERTFNYMVGLKIPFRRPFKTEKAVLGAIERTCGHYKNILTINREFLRYKDLVDYDAILSESVGK